MSAPRTRRGRVGRDIDLPRVPEAGSRLMLLSASSYAQQSGQQLAAQLGFPLPLSRVYAAAVPSSTPLGTTGRLVLSAKPNLADQATGKLDAAWEKLYTQLPTGSVVTIWHEPDSKMRSSQITYAAWRAAFDHWVGHANKHTNIVTMLNLTNGPWRWAPEDPSRYLTPNLPRVFGLDVYQDRPAQWLTPEALCGPEFEWALSSGFKWLAIPEFGAVADPRRAAWIKDMAAWLDRWDTAAFANYWTDSGSPFDVRGDASSLAALRSEILRHQY